MKIKFFGGTEAVTGSNFLVEIKGPRGSESQILIDCGLHQGSNFCEKHNFEPFPYDPQKIKAVFVTHAHIDHTGLLPKLYRQGFKGKVYSTPPTKDFAYELLLDSENILFREAERENKEPLYSKKDIDGLMGVWEGIDYGTPIEVGGFSVTLRNSGHILGSSSILVKADDRLVVFSGDLGNYRPPIIKESEVLDIPADYCLIESTYGNRLHEGLELRKGILENVIEETVKTKGVLMIPSFAMERTQEILYELNELVENGRIPRVPIFIDSPLAIKLTRVYQKYSYYFNDEASRLVKKGDALFFFPGLKMTLNKDESIAINDVPSPKVIIAGSGMSQGGRILHHEKRYLSDPNSAILFIGYQAYGSLGRQILEGAKSVKILGEDIAVRCRVRAIGAYSAHADKRKLLEWLYPMRSTLKKVFVVQGEKEASEALASAIKDKLAVDARAPSIKEEVVLE
ncbi:MAG TPA: MBL fold metallo-hydrolase [Candidatus Paceibacterota bacterium]